MSELDKSGYRWSWEQSGEVHVRALVNKEKDKMLFETWGATESCSLCKGSGSVSSQVGFFSVQHECGRCGGDGLFNKEVERLEIDCWRIQRIAEEYVEQELELVMLSREKVFGWFLKGLAAGFLASALCALALKSVF